MREREREKWKDMSETEIRGRKERARVRGAALNTEGCSTRKSRASRWCWRGIGVKTDCDGSGDDSSGDAGGPRERFSDEGGNLTPAFSFLLSLSLSLPDFVRLIWSRDASEGEGIEMRREKTGELTRETKKW